MAENKSEQLKGALICSIYSFQVLLLHDFSIRSSMHFLEPVWMEMREFWALCANNHEYTPLDEI